MMIGDRAKSPIFFAKYQLQPKKAITKYGIITSNEYNALKVGGINVSKNMVSGPNIFSSVSLYFDCLDSR